MSRKHAGTPLASLVRTLIGVAALTLLAAGCSGKSSSAPAVVAGPAFNFSFPGTGVSHQLQFTDVGSWGYHCIPHQSLGMTGTVIVDASSAVDSALVQVGPGIATVFQPSSVTIKPNGFVRWVNTGSMTNHTVTRP